MLSVAIFLLLCWMSLCWVSLCWVSLWRVSLCWVSLCWMSWRPKKFYNNGPRLIYNLFLQENSNMEAFIGHLKDEIEVIRRMMEAKRSGNSYSWKFPDLTGFFPDFCGKSIFMLPYLLIFNQFFPDLTRFYGIFQIFQEFSRFFWILPDFYGFFFSGIFPDFSGIVQIFLELSRFFWNCPDFSGIVQIFLELFRFFGIFQIFLELIRFFWISPDFSKICLQK